MAAAAKRVEQLDRVVIRFAGDSGDGMQLTGDRFTSETAQLGNDISTLPNFPAEIRAPAGTLPGVSSFQVHFADYDILTPGDSPERAGRDEPGRAQGQRRRPAARRRHHRQHRRVHQAQPGQGRLRGEPARGRLAGRLRAAPGRADLDDRRARWPSSTSRRRTPSGPRTCSPSACCPGCTRGRIESTLRFLERKFAKRPELVAANKAAFKAGWNFGETTEDFAVRYEVKPAKMRPGTYRNITGNAALALGLVAAGVRAKLPVFLGAYPITPASDILHELSKHKRFGITTMQAEDEIAAIGAALGASYGGALGVTTTSGPGVALKGETISLAVALELPLVIVDVQRAGPSTGMPTKTEQADLNMALYGRHGEAPVAVIAPKSPSDCFHAAIEAARIALTYRTPVILLSDNYVANGSEPWLLPDVDDLPDLRVDVRHRAERRGRPTFLPYLRDPETHGPAVGRSRARRAWSTGSAAWRRPTRPATSRTTRPTTTSWCAPGPPASRRSRCRTWRSRTRTSDARVLVLGWGSTYGPIGAACRALRQRGLPIAQAHLRHLSPLPANLGEVLKAYDRVVIPEMNLGQLAHVIRARYLVDAFPFNQVRGLPFTAAELENMLEDVVKNG